MNNNHTKRKRQDDNRRTKHNRKPNNNTHRFGGVMHQPPKLQLRPHTTPTSTIYPTVSIAIPGSVICNAQTRELQTSLAGSIARSAAVYRVDEIVVFDDGLGSVLKTLSNYRRGPREEKRKDPSENEANDNTTTTNEKPEKEQPSTDPHAFLARILQYCECPQYLRRKFFPMHPDLQFAGLLPPLDMPHHLRRNDVLDYREGVVTEEKSELGSLVDCGIPNRLVE